MKSSDRTILIVLPLIALAIGFYLLVLAPKQREAGELQDKADSLSAEIQTSETAISTAEAARSSFAKNYADMVKLGTAVPEDDDQATLIHDLDAMGTDNDLDFQSFAVSEDAAGATTSAPAPPASGTDSSSTSTDSTTTEASTTTTSAPTEASAATLPLGATVGPAGLPVTPYTLTYHGGFFDMAGLFSDLDNRVKVNDAGTDPIAHGRLMTVDGFAMSADPVKGFPSVAAEIGRASCRERVSYHV